jgi:hypothetical protein
MDQADQIIGCVRGDNPPSPVLWLEFPPCSGPYSSLGGTEDAELDRNRITGRVRLSDGDRVVQRQHPYGAREAVSRISIDIADDLLLALREQPQDVVQEMRLSAALCYFQTRRLKSCER